MLSGVPVVRQLWAERSTCGWKLLPRKWKVSQEPALPRKEESKPNGQFSFEGREGL